MTEALPLELFKTLPCLNCLNWKYEFVKIVLAEFLYILFVSGFCKGGESVLEGSVSNSAIASVLSI